MPPIRNTLPFFRTGMKYNIESTAKLSKPQLTHKLPQPDLNQVVFKMKITLHHHHDETFIPVLGTLEGF